MSKREERAEEIDVLTKGPMNCRRSTCQCHVLVCRCHFRFVLAIRSGVPG